MASIQVVIWIQDFQALASVVITIRIAYEVKASTASSSDVNSCITVTAASCLSCALEQDLGTGRIEGESGILAHIITTARITGHTMGFPGAACIKVEFI